MKSITLFAALLLATAACDGAREDAGEVADNQAGAVSSEDTIASGPAETMGERRDDVADAKEARADALEDSADERREAAEQQADALEKEAERTRGN